MSRPSILVTGGAHGDLPLLLELRKLGLRVITSGNRQSDLGHKLSDQYLHCDYTDVRGLVSIARAHQVLAIIPSCHDAAVGPASEAAHILGIPDGHDQPEVAYQIHRKDGLRDLWTSVGIPYPPGHVSVRPETDQPIAQNLGFPLIVKPTGLAGGRGIARVDSLGGLSAATSFARRASKEQHVLIEQFSMGSSHAVSCLVKGGRVALSFFDDEYYLPGTFRVTGAHSVTSLSISEQHFIIDSVQIMVHKLRLVDGLLHLQLIRQSGDIRFLELTRRFPGDLYPWLVEESGIRGYIRAVIGSYLPGNVNSRSYATPNRPLIRHVVRAKASGKFAGVLIPPMFASRLVKYYPLASLAETVEDPSTWAAGVALIQSTRELVESDVRALSSGEFTAEIEP